MAHTPEFYLADLRETTHDYVIKWEKLMERMAGAYDSAYESQTTLLGTVKKSVEARKERERALMVYTLSLVTVGIVGTIANRLVKKVDVGGASETLAQVAAKEAQDSVVAEWTRGVVTTLAKDGTKKLQSVTLDPALAGSGKVDDGFSPLGMTPNSYGHSLKEGVFSRAEIVADFARICYRESDKYTADFAKNLRDFMLYGPFFTTLPETDVDKDTLTRNAKLALWIAWARARDKSYWQTQVALAQGYYASYSEAFDFGPVCDELVSLGVPSSLIVIESNNYLTGTTSRGLNMCGLIDWATGVTAPAALYQNLPTNTEGMKYAQDRFFAKKWLGR
jgi:hypothetical protein